MNNTEEGNVSVATEGDAAPSQMAAVLAQLEQMSNEYDKLALEKAELQDLVRRREADYDNFRKRTEREKQDFAEYAAMDTCKALLPMLDDFERGLRAAEGQEAVQEYAKGIGLIHQRMLESLTRLGLEAIDCAGKPFDPALHYAVQKVERDDLDDQTVIEDLQRGYRFKGRLLRAAMVKVAVKP